MKELDEKVIDFSKTGIVYDSIAKFYKLMTQADSIISQENFDEFADWLDSIKCLRYHAQERVDEIRRFEHFGVSA